MMTLRNLRQASHPERWIRQPGEEAHAPPAATRISPALPALYSLHAYHAQLDLSQSLLHRNTIAILLTHA
jgi:hypothetical protein